MPDDYPEAHIEQANPTLWQRLNGEEPPLVLHDPAAEAMIAVVEAHNRKIAKENCRKLFENQAERIAHFQQRYIASGAGPGDVIIVLVQVDDPYGAGLADALMPGYDWQALRDRGEVPYARGLAGRAGITEAVTFIDPEVGKRLEAIPGLAVAIVGYGTAEVYPAP
jgi:hypothetical protein